MRLRMGLEGGELSAAAYDGEGPNAADAEVVLLLLS